MRLAALNTLWAAIDVPPLSRSGRCTTVEYKLSTSCGDFGEAKGYAVGTHKYPPPATSRRFDPISSSSSSVNR